MARPRSDYDDTHTHTWTKLHVAWVPQVIIVQVFPPTLVIVQFAAKHFRFDCCMLNFCTQKEQPDPYPGNVTLLSSLNSRSLSETAAISQTGRDNPNT